MALTDEQNEQARERARQYQASMAIEDLHLSAEGRAALEEIHAARMDYDDGVQHMIARLREAGVIANDRQAR